MKIVLLRVGVDKICGGTYSPLFKNGTFEFLPIPEYFYRNHPFDKNKVKTYATENGKSGKPFIEYFAEGKDKEDHRNCPIHHDPDFKTFTYGDGNSTKQTLVNLEKGDFIVYYAMLQGQDFTMPPALYVIGYFEVEYALLATEQDQYELLENDFKHNFHVANKEIYDRDIENPKNKGLKLVKGSANSRLLKYAYLISRKIEIPKKADVHIISDEMLKVFGSFGGKIAIQKEPLRWIKDKDLVANTVAWLKSLE
ncbi:MAG: hypothetical protein ACKVOU_11375 [Cytophagales bacterium]